MFDLLLTRFQCSILTADFLPKYTGNAFVRHFSPGGGGGGTVACLETALLMCKILLLVLKYFIYLFTSFSCSLGLFFLFEEQEAARNFICFLLH